MLEILLLAIGLGADAFSVSLGVGARWCGKRQVFRLAFHFGLFQFFMPLIGWQLGTFATTYIGPMARFIAAATMGAIAIKMIVETLKGREDDQCDTTFDPTKGWSLIVLSIATSVDALGAGFGMGLVASHLFIACVVIGVTAFIMTAAGMKLANTLSAKFGKPMEIIGASVLFLLALKILFGF